MENSQQHTSANSLLKNVLYGFSTWFLPLGLSFLATPLIVRTLGNQDYGIYALVISLIGYTFNLNFGRAVTKYVAEYRANGETEKIKNVISASLSINLFFGVIGVFLIILAARWLVADVLQIQEGDREKTVYAIYIASFTVFSLIISQVFSAILQGIYRFDIYSKIFNFNNVATLVGNLFLAYNNFGLNYLLAWNLLTNIITLILYFIGSKRLLPEFKISARFQPEFVKMVLKYSAGIVAYQVLGNALILFERGWITRYLGSENLTFYVVPMQLSFYIHGFVSSIIMIIFPLASELKDNREKLLRLYLKATKVVCFFVFFLAALLIVESRTFLTLWMGADFAEKTALLLIIHTITFSLLAIQGVSWQMVEGLGYPSYNTYIFMVCLVINACVLVVTTESYGNLGAAFARLAGFGTMFFFVFYIEKLFFKAVQVRFWFSIVIRLTSAAFISGIVQYFIARQFSPNWITFVLTAGIGGIVYCLALWIIGFLHKEEIELVKNTLKRGKLK